MPVISVLMSVYNGEKFLAESIRSILNQTIDDFEFIIVDDGSVDKTLLILKDFSVADSRIKIISNRVNEGLTKSLNTGLAVCVGKYVARQDADDISMPNRLEKQISFMDLNNGMALIGSCGFFVDDSGRVVRDKNLPISYPEIKRKLLFNNQFIHSSLMIRREILQKEGGYNDSFFKSQDYELVLRLAAKYPVANLPDKLVKHRLLNTAISWQSKTQEWDAIRARWWGITKNGYPFWFGVLNICLRLCWMAVPQKVKLTRYLFN